MLQEAGRDDLDADTATIRCLAHVIHLAVMDLLVRLKAVKKTDVHEEEIDLLPLTEDLAEAIAGDFDEGEKTDDDIVEEQRSQDGNEVLASMIGRVRHNVTFFVCNVITPALFVFKLRSLCKVSRSSPQRMEGFFECIKLSNTRQEARAKEKKVSFIPLALRVLIIDCVTRWNSLYFMLERAYTYRKVRFIFFWSICSTHQFV
jgi:hypothetical protein